jgi:hypothetical protein
VLHHQLFDIPASVPHLIELLVKIVYFLLLLQIHSQNCFGAHLSNYLKPTVVAGQNEPADCPLKMNTKYLPAGSEHNLPFLKL